MNGEQIKELRLKHKISQYKLASMLHTNQSAVSKWELGKRSPNRLMNKRLHRIFGIKYVEPKPVKEKRVQLNYKLIYELEREHGSLIKAEENNDPRLIQLQNEMNGVGA